MIKKKRGRGCTKTVLAAKVSERVGVPRSTCTKIVNAAFKEIVEALARGENASFVGFGSFRVRQRAARQVRNPQTGETFWIPVRNTVVFQPSPALKQEVGDKKK